EILFKKAEEILGVSSSYMEKHLMDLAIEKKVYLYSTGEDSLVYSYQFFRMEKNVALMLCSLNGRLKVDEEKARARIARVEEEDGISLDEHQREAIMAAASHGLTVLTGGPGTGKTTTIQSLIHFFDEEELSVSLAAPTGRAAKRMGEATGREAQTIHRLLEFLPPDDEEISSGGKITFRRNASNPLECEVLIIDEMSMVDITLMHSLLLAIAPGTRVVLVGDENQLPSVGPGNVLKDIIASGVVPVVELTRIFRQAGESDIVVNAHKIMKGEQVVADNKSKDFFLLRRYDAEKIVAVTLALVGQKLPPYVGGTFRDVQVLTPMRKGLLGVEGLNGALQAYLNPPSEEKREMEVGDHIFREGDRVMQTKNNYQMKWVVKGKKGIDVDEGVGVFNGDMGILKEIDEAEGFAKVEFEDGRLAEYEIKMLEDLDLSYAITIHKSQGSEYPAVVMPLLAGPAPLMNRNLLYTAVTRAKKCVTIVGSEQTFAQMIRNERQMKRYSSLDAQIRMFYEQD
ncbi:MAG: AAA family ATPase, partial [Blautia sp.]|nr:AAA family ATPase [Blautia sp.]